MDRKNGGAGITGFVQPHVEKERGVSTACNFDYFVYRISLRIFRLRFQNFELIGF